MIVFKAKDMAYLAIYHRILALSFDAGYMEYNQERTLSE